MADDDHSDSNIASYNSDEDFDDDMDFFPINEPIVNSHAPQSGIAASTTTEERESSGQSMKKYADGSEMPSIHPQALSLDDIVECMLECIKEVNEVIKLPSTIVRLLLHHCHWDKQKLMERFYDPIDQPALFRQAHIVNPQERSPALTPAVEQTCAICCSTKPSHEMCGLGCGHVFCKVCWQRYLTTKIMDEGIELSVPCPTECDDPVDDRTVLDLIEAQTVRQKYQYLITQSFVEYNGNMRWCPGTICTDAIEASNRDVAMASIDDLLIIHDRDKDLFSKTTGTSCETSFCFQCGQSWHEPIRCEWLERWQKKCNDDSETNHWIAVNAKDCPECHTTMEKTGGCNRAMCRNPSCNHKFCWICLGDWEPHGSSWYNCVLFTDDEVQRARVEQERSRVALQRYLRYWKGYHHHQTSMRSEQELLERVQNPTESMEQHMNWIELQLLQTLYDVLRQCRQTLMYSYPFAFYLKRNNHSIIFETIQADLEKDTEKLSDYLEGVSAQRTNLTEMKQEVQDTYRYCRGRRQALLDHVAEGYECKHREFNEEF